MKNKRNGMGRAQLHNFIVNFLRTEYGYTNVTSVVIAGDNKNYSYGLVDPTSNKREYTLAPRKVNRIKDALNNARFYVKENTVIIQDMGTTIFDFSDVMDSSNWAFVTKSGSALLADELNWLSAEEFKKYIENKGDLVSVYNC